MTAGAIPADPDRADLPSAGASPAAPGPGRARQAPGAALAGLAATALRLALVLGLSVALADCGRRGLPEKPERADGSVSDIGPDVDEDALSVPFGDAGDRTGPRVEEDVDAVLGP